MNTRATTDLSGWLISPEGNLCYRFYRDKKSWQKNPFIYVDKWITTSNGLPSQLKVRKKMPLDDALELCGQMLLEGWEKLSNQITESDDLQYNDEMAA